MALSTAIWPILYGCWAIVAEVRPDWTASNMVGNPSMPTKYMPSLRPAWSAALVAAVCSGFLSEAAGAGTSIRTTGGGAAGGVAAGAVVPAASGEHVQR